jgi:hypothetical protein
LFWRRWAGLQGPTPENKYCVTVAELASRNQGRRMPAGGGLLGGHRGLGFAYRCEPAVHHAGGLLWQTSALRTQHRVGDRTADVFHFEEIKVKKYA